MSARARLLFAEAGTGRRPLDAVEVVAERPTAERAGLSPDDVLYRPSGELDHLPDQRWGLVAPEGRAGDAIIDALAPLIALRAAEQNADVEVRRVPTGLADRMAARWVRDAVVGRNRSLYDADVPRYRLVVGDLDAVSPAVSDALATHGLTGRLAFDRPEDYAAYAIKACRAIPSVPSAPRLVAADTGRDGFAALLDPIGAWLGERCVSDGAVEHAPTPAALAHAAREAAVMLTLSHGIGAPAAGWSHADAMYRTQGALDLGAASVLDAAAVASGPWLPGGLWIIVACFGAGTPAETPYRPWLERLAAAGHIHRAELDGVLRSLPSRAGGRPFVSALCKAALANPAGPLAIIGHLDLAWSYAFESLDGGRRSDPAGLGEAVRQAAGGERFGVALDCLQRGARDAGERLLAGVYADSPIDEAHLWMLRHDLRGYVLLGDPAARAVAR